MSASTLKIGWIGAGRMGAALATRLARRRLRRHRLQPHRRPRRSLWPTAVPASSSRPVDLADRDVVFTMVSSSSDLEQVMLGDGGLLDRRARRRGSIVDCSTVSAESSAR